MFGEDLILGETIGKIDSTNRIFLPSFTKIEKNEKLLIQTIENNNELALKIIALNKYLVIIERFRKLRDNSTSIEEFEKYDNEISNVCKKLDALVKVDNQKRLQLPNSLMQKLNWSKNSEIIYTGLGDSLLVRKK